MHASFFKIVARRPTNHLSLNGDDIRCFSAPSCMFFQLEAPAKTLKKQWPKSFTVIKTVTRSRRRLLKKALCDRALSSCTFRDKLASGLFFLWFFMQKAKKGRIWLKVELLSELPADQITLIETHLKFHMSGKPETQVPLGHLNLPQSPVGVVGGLVKLQR